MALNKLKKWIGTQTMTAFFDQLNDNVDATNAAIDAVDSLIDFSSSLTPLDGVEYLRAYKVGRVHFLSFSYKPTETGFTIGVIQGIPSAYLPGIHFAGSVGTTTSFADAGKGIVTAITTGGSVYVSATTLPSSLMRFTFTWIA